MAGPEHTDRDEAIRRRMESPEASAVEKGLAAVSGAAEGFAEVSERADLPALAGEAVDRIAGTWRAVREEMRGPTGGAAEAATAYPPQTGAEVWPATPGTPGIAPTHGTTEPSAAGEKTSEFVRKAEGYTRAAGESARRARELPTSVKHHVKATTKEVAKDAGGAMLWFGVAAITAIFALAFVSIWVAVLLNDAFDSHVGTLIVGIFYAIVAGIGAAVGKKRVDDAKRDAKAGYTTVREEVRNVARPFGEVR